MKNNCLSVSGLGAWLTVLPSATMPYCRHCGVWGASRQNRHLRDPTIRQYMTPSVLALQQESKRHEEHRQHQSLDELLDQERTRQNSDTKYLVTFDGTGKVVSTKKVRFGFSESCLDAF